MIAGEVGYEHYFMNYYLYLPFSRDQESIAIKESIEILTEMEILKLDKLNEMVEEIEKVYESMKKISVINPKEIKEKLKLPNKKRIDIIKNDMKLQFDNSFCLNDNSSQHPNEFFNENDEIFSNYIYGDYKYKNENVEVYLHQRTTKKVKYKKREFNLIHPIDKYLLKNILLHGINNEINQN